MKIPKFMVLEGGVTYLLNNKKKFLVSAYVTDTRLMGVLALYAHWKLEGSEETSDFHQFFYIDCEDGGFETYLGIAGNDNPKLQLTEQRLVGGLGARKIDITHRQLCGILTYYKEFNQIHNLPMPACYSEYSFLLEPEVILNPAEHAELMKLICGEITSDYQSVNYFMMRCFGRDYKGAAYLATDNVTLNVYDNYTDTSFCKNVIDKNKDYDDGATAYLCESLIESQGNYETVISKVVVKDLKIVHFEHCSGFRVSPAEAAMMLSKGEYLTVYEVLLSDDDIEDNIDEFRVTSTTIMNRHPSGRLFMVYKKTNDHVNSRIFYIHSDIKGLYFLTDYGQLLAVAYNLSDIRYMENQLKEGPLAPFLMTTSKYEFKEPVLFEFIQSDFEDFDEFIHYIKDE